MIIHGVYINICSRYEDTTIELQEKVRNGQRIKRGTIPENPENVAEIEDAFKSPKIMNTFGMSAHKSNKKIFFDGAVKKADHSFCVFSSKTIVELVKTHIPVDERHILIYSWMQRSKLFHSASSSSCSYSIYESSLK